MPSSPHPIRQALITGASRGIGRAVALKLAQQNIRLALVARSREPLQEVAETICSLGGEAQPYVIDLQDLKTLPDQLQLLLQEFGSCQLLVNNAGRGYTAPLAQTPLLDWQQLIDLNLTSAFLCAQAVIPAMRTQGFGVIVNVISVAGRQAFANWGAYCASKFALMGFSQSLAQEERPHGIRVTAFCPGAVDTPLWDSPQVQAHLDRSRMLTADAVAEALVQIALLSPQAVVEEISILPAGGVL